MQVEAWGAFIEECDNKRFRIIDQSELAKPSFIPKWVCIVYRRVGKIATSGFIINLEHKKPIVYRERHNGFAVAANSYLAKMQLSEQVHDKALRREVLAVWRTIL